MPVHYTKKEHRNRRFLSPAQRVTKLSPRYKPRGPERTHVPIQPVDVPSLPPDTCVKQHIPASASFALGSLQLLLQHVQPGNFVAFDIDDTLVKKRHFGCSLLTQEGLRRFHVHLQQHKKEMNFAEKQQLVNDLHKELKATVLAEDITSEVVKTLQDRGVFVFGLTARSSTMASATTTTLRSLGINLAANPPASLPQKAVEPGTGAVIVDGIVYCNEVDKGVVLQRLIQQRWIQIYGNDTINHSHKHSDDGHTCPNHTLWFIDDSLPMIAGMIQQWQTMAHSYANVYASMGELANQIPCKGKLSLICCHYSHPQLAQYKKNNADAIDVDKCIEAQIQHFISHREILLDCEAGKM